MGFFGDMFAVFKKREITFVKSQQESRDVYSFIFNQADDISWQGGQYSLFTISHKKVKQPTKPFSISSSPTEGIVQITTRIGDHPSQYKQALLELKPGMKIKMSGALGAFKLDESQPSLLIAGGIGVTPFRAMLKQLASQGTKPTAKLQLLYLDSSQSYLFTDELNALAKQLSIEIQYLITTDELNQSIDTFISTHRSNGQFFIAGAKALVEDVSSYLQSQHISKSSIKKDSFFGY